MANCSEMQFVLPRLFQCFVPLNDGIPGLLVGLGSHLALNKESLSYAKAHKPDGSCDLHGGSPRDAFSGIIRQPTVVTAAGAA